ncbi:UNVERIFIED_CONTAM: Cytochrome c oxidase subunit [Sesamum calycinum]|uniref:Cytochrome c oxidase subunit 2 n=1 Tax=Sesamum calycinum TaxID=2727403 RepID=A0AAW2K6V8_9LAMI
MPLHSHAFLGWTKAIPVFLNWESKSLFFFGGAEQSKNEPKKMIVLECLFLTIAPCDAAEPWQLGSQDAATPMMQGIIDLHHDIFFFLILIFVFVSWILVRALWHFHYKKNPIPQRIVHGTTIEILWTIFPSIILMFIAIPSFALLYSMDEVVVDPAITIKAIGHQWYWTYEYSDYNSGDEQSLTFDSYTIPEDDPELGQSRLLEVDNRVVVPEKTHLRIIVTPADVPHSWAVPSLGVKCDAVPGRLNQTSISVQREGVYYGCEPPEKQAITASGWSSMEPRSKAVDKIEEGARLPVEERRRLGITNLKRGARAAGERVVMRRGPVQDRTVPLQRQQTLSTARRHSLSELFQLLYVMISCRAVCYESGKPPQYEGSLQNREDRSGAPRGYIRTCSDSPVIMDIVAWRVKGGSSSEKNFSMGTLNLNSRVANQAKNHRPIKQAISESRLLFLLESTPLVSATVIFSAAIDVGGISAAISYAANLAISEATQLQLKRTKLFLFTTLLPFHPLQLARKRIQSPQGLNPNKGIKCFVHESLSGVKEESGAIGLPESFPWHEREKNQRNTGLRANELGVQ